MEFQIDILLKILAAFLIGVVIGLDREVSGKPAGIRTQMLVCVGSALLSGVSVHLRQFYASPNADPARLMAQIVSGIGFLGAGIIIKNGNRVTGLTTAATIWVSSAIGIAIGANFYFPAIVTTLLVLSLRPIANIQYAMGLKADYYVLTVVRKRERETGKILKREHIVIQSKNLKKSKAEYTILSSMQRNQQLERTLGDRRITFSVIRKERDGNGYSD